MRKMLIGIVVVAALVFGGAKLYVHHKVTSAADKMAVIAQPYASISYDEATSNLWNGRVGLTGIIVRPTAGDATVRIRKITAEFGSPTALFKAVGAVGDDKIPDELDIKIKNLRWPLNSELLATRSFGPEKTSHRRMGQSFTALACGDRRGFSASDLRQMGINTIDTDLELAYQLKRGSDGLTVQMKSRQSGINRVVFELSLFRNQASNGNRASLGNVSITHAHLHYRDLGWNRRWRRFCSRQSDFGNGDFVTAHTKALRLAVAQMGVGVSDDMAREYRNLLADDAELDVTIDPPTPLQLGKARYYTVDQLLYYLNPAVKVDGDTVPIAIEKLDAKTIVDAKATAKARRKRINERTSNYRAIDPGTLARHVDEKVRLEIKNGHVFKGTLVEVGPRAATLHYPGYSGETKEVLVLLRDLRETAVAKPPTSLASKADGGHS